MNTPSFEEALRAVGVSEEAIHALIENEYTEVSQLINLHVNDFLAFGIKGRSAAILAEKFGKRSGGQPVALEQSVPQPIKVEVSLPKLFDQMGTLELLSQLAGDPNNADALAVLLAKPEVIAASSKTDAWAVPGTNSEVKLDVDATVAYIRYLGKSGSVPQRMYQGRRPKSIHVILGVVEKTLVNPFTGEPVVECLDELGNDWSKVDRTLMKAILWARLTRHALFPASIDAFSAFEEISKKTLPRRWQTILDDYNAAVEDEDHKALSVSLVWKVSANVADSNGGGGISSVAQQPNRIQAVDPESSVREMCQGDGSLTSMSGRLTGVFTNLTVTGMDCRVDVVVLGFAKVTGMSCKGSIYLAPGANIEITGMDCSAQVRRVSWEQLTELVRDW